MHRKDRVKMKKKIIYAILICIIIAGIVIIPTIGLKADLMYSKNVEIDVYLGICFSMSDMEQVVGEVFPGEKTIIQEIELFGDMAAITIPDTRSVGQPLRWRLADGLRFQQKRSFHHEEVYRNADGGCHDAGHGGLRRHHQ